MRGISWVWLGLLLVLGAGSRGAAAQSDPIEPLPVATALHQAKLTCADFRKNLPDGSWAPTHDLRLAQGQLSAGTLIGQSPIDGINLQALLEKRCQSRAP